MVILTTLYQFVATFMVSKNYPIKGEHIVIIFVAQQIATNVATVWPAKNTLNVSFNCL